MNTFINKPVIMFAAIFSTSPLLAVTGTLVDEKLTPSGKTCYYDVGNGVTKSINIGRSEMCPQTYDL